MIYVLRLAVGELGTVGVNQGLNVWWREDYSRELHVEVVAERIVCGS